MFAKAQQTDYDFFDVTGICVYYRKKTILLKSIMTLKLHSFQSKTFSKC